MAAAATAPVIALTDPVISEGSSSDTVVNGNHRVILEQRSNAWVRVLATGSRPTRQGSSVLPGPALPSSRKVPGAPSRRYRNPGCDADA
jgi:hypothetical protein